MFFSRTSSKKVDEFAGQLARQIAAKFPPEFDIDSRKAIPEKRLARILEDAFSAAQTFKNENKLGVYKKARLSNSFRWELKQLGYTNDFVELATEAMVVYLTRKDEKSTDNEKI